MNFVKETIKNRIAFRQYLPNTRLRSERAFAKEFNLPLSKTHRFLRELVDEGYLHSKRGNGYFVNSRKNRPNGNVLKVEFIIDSISQISDQPIPNIASGLFMHQAANENILLKSREMNGDWSVLDDVLNDLLDNKSVDAVVIHASKKFEWCNALTKAMLENYPVIFRDYCPFPNTFSSAGCNNFELGLMAAHKLAEQKNRKPVYLGYKEDWSVPAEMRLAGFKTGCGGRGPGHTHSKAGRSRGASFPLPV